MRSLFLVRAALTVLSLVLPASLIAQSEVADAPAGVMDKEVDKLAEAMSGEIDFADVPLRPKNYDDAFLPEHKIKSISLYRAAALDYELNGAIYEPFSEQLTWSSPDVRIYSNSEGKPIHCEKDNSQLSEDATKVICADLMANLTVKPTLGLDLGGWPSVIGVDIRFRQMPDYEVSQPIVFSKTPSNYDKKPARPGAVWIRPGGLPNSPYQDCGAYSPFGAEQLTEESYSIVCDAFLALSDPKLAKCKRQKAVGFMPERYRCQISVQKVAVKKPPEIALDNVNFARETVATPPLYREELPLLGAEAGHIAARLQYPTRALRREISGTTAVLVSIDATRRVRTCRIFRSSGSAELDSETCRGMLRSGRFFAAPDSEPIVGERYAIQQVTWRIP